MIAHFGCNHWCEALGGVLPSASGLLLPRGDGIGQLPPLWWPLIAYNSSSRDGQIWSPSWSEWSSSSSSTLSSWWPECSKINFEFTPQQQNTNPHPYFLLCLIISVPGNQNDSEIFLNLIEPLTWLPRFIHRAHFLFCFGITNAMSPFKESDVG